MGIFLIIDILVQKLFKKLYDMVYVLGVHTQYISKYHS